MQNVCFLVRQICLTPSRLGRGSGGDVNYRRGWMGTYT